MYVAGGFIRWLPRPLLAVLADSSLMELCKWKNIMIGPDMTMGKRKKSRQTGTDDMSRYRDIEMSRYVEICRDIDTDCCNTSWGVPDGTNLLLENHVPKLSAERTSSEFQIKGTHITQKVTTTQESVAKRMMPRYKKKKVKY